MNTLFLTWGTVYFIVAEVFAFLIGASLARRPTQLWLLAIIVIGYIGLTVVAALAGLPVQNVIELVIGFIVVAAVSLWISYLLSRYDESLAPKDQGIKN
jgi:quinol-cytochrome oxidoreductase complex cytochrome b subunit